MSKVTGNNQNKYFISTGTVAQPVHIQTAPLAAIVSGTLGHTGPVEYSKSATAVVSETYVVTTKK